MDKIRKFIGNILLIGGLLCFFAGMLLQGRGDHELFKTLMMCYAIGIVGGGILRIGDFFKWRAKKFQQGINEAQKNSANTVGAAQFCPHCGKPLSSKTAFCPHCGKALN